MWTYWLKTIQGCKPATTPTPPLTGALPPPRQPLGNLRVPSQTCPLNTSRLWGLSCLRQVDLRNVSTCFLLGQQVSLGPATSHTHLPLVRSCTLQSSASPALPLFLHPFTPPLTHLTKRFDTTLHPQRIKIFGIYLQTIPPHPLSPRPPSQDTRQSFSTP